MKIQIKEFSLRQFWHNFQVPVVLFALLHSASYSLTLLDTLGIDYRMYQDVTIFFFIMKNCYEAIILHIFLHMSFF